MPIVSIRHLTTYRYQRPVGFGEHRMMLRPLSGFDQRLVSAELEISPEPSLLRHVQDVTGACVGVARFAVRADRLAIESRAVVEHRPGRPFELEGADATLSAAGFAYEPSEAAELAGLVKRRQEDDGAVSDWARRFLRPIGRSRVSAVLCDMTHAMRADFTYQTRLEGPPQLPAETLALRQGSCRDFAVLMIEAARSLGLAARFVSGYVYAGASKGRSGMSGAGGKGGGHTHAWAQVYVTGCGWTDFDPTNGAVGNAGLIRVATASEPRLALPLHGTWDGRRSDFLGLAVEVELTVEADDQGERDAQPLPPLRVAAGAS